MNKVHQVQFSIVVPCYNAGETILPCLEALSRQSLQREIYEVIVVDDGSTDRTAAIAKSKCDILLRIPNSGPAAARNRGARAASGNIILFTDSDCVPCTDWLEKMTVPFADPEIQGTKGTYRTRQIEAVARFVQAEYEYKYRRMERLKSIDFIDTYSAAFRRSVFLELGGFDEQFPGASVEDQEFSFRMAAAGHCMVFVPDAIVEHRHADTIAWYFRKKRNIGFWKILVLKRHPGKIVTDSHTPQTLKIQLPLAASLIPAAALAPLTGLLPLAVLTGMFIAAGAGEILQCYRRWGIVSAAGAPVLMWVRSMGLGIGLCSGFLYSVHPWKIHKPRHPGEGKNS